VDEDRARHTVIPKRGAILATASTVGILPVHRRAVFVKIDPTAHNTFGGITCQLLDQRKIFDYESLHCSSPKK
jgi:hypothetical protein